jgi:hypothetical protein
MKEIGRLKERILEEIAENGIKIYSLPDCDSDEDEEYKLQVFTQHNQDIITGDSTVPGTSTVECTGTTIYVYDIPVSVGFRQW